MLFPVLDNVIAKSTPALRIPYPDHRAVILSEYSLNWMRSIQASAPARSALLGIDVLPDVPPLTSLEYVLMEDAMQVFTGCANIMTERRPLFDAIILISLLPWTVGCLTHRFDGFATEAVGCALWVIRFALATTRPRGNRAPL
jgi:hypothetical protein